MGERVQPGEIPYQAALFRSDGQFNCGGSLFLPTWVLTAAHCVPEDRVVEVRLGGTNWNDQPYVQVADRAIVHERYNPDRIENDVAVLRLPMAASGPNIGMITLAPASTGRLANVPVRASGYGFTQNTGPPSEDMLKVNLVTMANRDCRTSHLVFLLLLNPENICARYSSNRNQAVCHGDSGGPLIYTQDGQETQIGIVSFGVGGMCNTAPQAFVRVGSYRDWIDNAVATNS